MLSNEKGSNIPKLLLEGERCYRSSCMCMYHIMHSIILAMIVSNDKNMCRQNYFQFQYRMDVPSNIRPSRDEPLIMH